MQAPPSPSLKSAFDDDRRVQESLTEQEAKLRRKIDLHLLPIVMLLYVVAVIDRSNVGNARLAGFEQQLHLQGYDYNIVLSTFFASYILFEIPSAICNKLVGPGKWVPILTVTFGMAFVRNLATAAIVRFALGIAEAGMLPSFCFYLSRWYRKWELGTRIACLISCLSFSGAFGGLLSSMILRLHGIGSVHRWAMIFLIEGISTTCLGVIGYLLLTDTIDSAKWLTLEEKQLANWRVSSENAGQLSIIDRLRSRSVWEGATQLSTLVIAMIFAFDNIIMQGASLFTPTVIATIFPGHTVVQQQLLTVPPWIVGAVCAISNAMLSDRYGNRCLFLGVPALVVVVAFSLMIAANDSHLRYAGLHLALGGGAAIGALTPTWASINAVSDSSRAGAIGAVVFAGNCGGLVATWAFLHKDAPRYFPGNSLNLASAAAIFILAFSLGTYMRNQNARRDASLRMGNPAAKLNDDNAEVRDADIEEEHLGQRHPNFRFQI